MKVLIVDQFCGLTPCALSQDPTGFDELVEQVLAVEHVGPSWTAPRVEDVDECFVPSFATTVIRANPQTGLAEVWKYCWDSSG